MRKPYANWQNESVHRNATGSAFRLSVFTSGRLDLFWRDLISLVPDRPGDGTRLLTEAISLFRSHETLRQRVVDARLERERLRAQKYRVIAAHPEAAEWFKSAHEETRTMTAEEMHIGWDGEPGDNTSVGPYGTPVGIRRIA